MSVVDVDRSVLTHRRETVRPSRVRRVALLGCGRVGQAVAILAADEHSRLADAGIHLEFIGALVRDPARTRSGPPMPLRTSISALLDLRPDLLIDVMGGADPAGSYVRAAIDAGVHVVTASKTLVASYGPELSRLARARGVVFAFDAAVLAGVPFLGALARRPLMASARRISGIINGTTHFITCRLAEGASFEAALAEAVSHGYAEPDSEADVSGRDAAEKLAILLHLAGCRDVRVADLPTRGLDTLSRADAPAARAIGGVIKPVALASLDHVRPGAWVGPAVVDDAHPFAGLSGITNAIEFAGPGDPVMFTGPGAGPRVTAATILDDVAEAFDDGRTCPRELEATVHADAFREPPEGRWFVRWRSPRSTADAVATRMAAAGVPVLRIASSEGTIVARTGIASWSAVTLAATTSEADALVLPVVEAERPHVFVHTQSSDSGRF